VVYRIEMNYADDSLSMEVPEGKVLGVIGFNEVACATDERVELESALDNPIGHKGLKSLSSKGKGTVILVDDVTRPTPANRILPIMLNRLNEAGVPDRDISILLAVGTHRMMNDHEISEKVGEEALGRVSVTNHYWKQKEMLTDLGKTASGVPISVNKHYLEARIKLAIGHIVPHTQAGWTGGAKIVQPGVCGAETTDFTHWLSAKYDLRDLMGIADNPVRLEIENVVRKVGLDFILNVILNDKKEIVKAVTGNFVDAHRKGVEEAKKVYVSKVPAPPDIVVCDSTPTCYSVDLWQASKAIMSSYLPIKKGGTIILLAPLPEGVSSEHPELAKFGHRPYKDVKRLVDSGEMRDLNAAASSSQIGQILADNVRVTLYSAGLSKPETEVLGFEYTDNPQNALDEAIRRYGDCKVLFLRNACEILPVL
jgi:nickel-dependent lactate racemase